MKQRNRIHYLGTIAFLMIVSVFAADGQSKGVSANAPAVVTEDEPFSFTVSGDIQGDVSFPDVKGVKVLAGPSSMVSYQSSNINGKLQNTMKVSYTFMLKISGEGEYTIPPLSVKTGKKTYETNAVKIRVIKGTANVRSSRPQGGQQPSSANGKGVILKQIPSKTDVYVGEQLVLSTKVYVRERLQITNLKTPPYEGFWNDDLDADKAAGRDVINGLTYSSQVINRQLLTAQKSGDIRLEPAEMDVLIQKRVRRQSNPFGDIFDDPFFDNAFNNYKTVPDSYESNPVTIHVKPLPSGAPASFDGAVGDFNMKAEISKDSTLANESVTLKVTISGRGNLQLLQPVKVDFPPDLEVFDPKTNKNIRNTTSGSVGTVTFEYLIIPRNRGNFRIAPVTFTSFNPQTGRYHTVKSLEFTLKVSGNGTENAQGGVQQMPQGFFRDEVKSLGSDIRFIHTDPGNLRKKDRSLLHSPWMLLYPGGILILIILFVTRKQRLKKHADVYYIRSRKARKKAVQRLKTARHLLNLNNDGFYEEILKACWGYLSDKFGIDTSDLSRDRIQEHLERVNVPGEVSADLWSLIDECEYSRYAPGETRDKQPVYARAENILSRIEENV